MRKSMFKKMTCVLLGAALVMQLCACGNKEVSVDDYGSSNSSAAAASESATDTDSSASIDKEYAKANGKSLHDVVGDRINWNDELSINGKSVKVSINQELPKADTLNVYKAHTLDDGKSEEAEIVKNLFGDSAKKLDEVSYKNETEYIMMLSKLRDIHYSVEGEYMADYNDDFSEVEFYKNHMSMIGQDNCQTYKWTDEDNYYIHMYEGLYEGVRFGLILAYDKSSGRRFIYFSPIDINEYFPGYEFKTLATREVHETDENICEKSEDVIKEEISKFLHNKLNINEGDNKIVNSADYSLMMAQSPSAIPYSINGSESRSCLAFSDADLVSTVQNGGNSNETISTTQLAEQQDLIIEGMEKYNCGYYEFIMGMHNVQGTVEPNLVRDGYAMYLTPAYALENAVYNYSGTYNPANGGSISVTDKGIFEVDLALQLKIDEVVEDVQLMDFEKIKECLINELNTNLDYSKLGDSKSYSLDGGFLEYMCYNEAGSVEGANTEFAEVPVWTFWIYGEEIRVENDTTSGMAFISINAMDGSVVVFDYSGGQG